MEFGTRLFHITRMRKQIALLCLCGSLAGCVGNTPSVVGQDEPAPNYRAIIAQNLRSPRSDPQIGPADTATSTFFDDRGNIFSNPKLIGSVEVSDSVRRELSSNLGWTWMTCIRAQIGATSNTYAIFIEKNTIVDARKSILTDHCEGMNYQFLDTKLPEAKRPIKKRASGNR